MEKSNTKTPLCAGVDVGKTSLSYALADGSGPRKCMNSKEGRVEMIAFLKVRNVERVGMESTGVYHFDAADELRAEGFEVVVLLPSQVKAYAKFSLQRAKSDPIDAVLIAQCTSAYHRSAREAPDSRLIPLAEHLTFIEQVEEDIARLKVRRERFREPRLMQALEDEIKTKKALKRREIRALIEAMRARTDLARRFELLTSIPGLGDRTALALVIRMPELGKVSREEIASLLGVAPFVHESGAYKGQRRTGGGRARARTSLFAAVQAAARRWNPALIALYDRLIKLGKPHAAAIIACVRKMIIYANTVLARDTPWEDDYKPSRKHDQPVAT